MKERRLSLASTRSLSPRGGLSVLHGTRRRGPRREAAGINVVNEVIDSAWLLARSDIVEANCPSAGKTSCPGRGRLCRLCVDQCAAPQIAQLSCLYLGALQAKREVEQDALAARLKSLRVQAEAIL